MKEVWKQIHSYEGIYEISSYGNVKSLDRYIPNTNGVGKRMIKGRQMKTCKNNSGYHCITLKNNGNSKTLTVHRLVATHFIPNPNHYEDVNHNDECKGNNLVNNLMWMSHKDNINYGDRNKKASEKLKGTRTLSGNGNASKVINMDTLKEFNTILEASYHYNIPKTGISNCCRNKAKTCGGYEWMYYKDYLNKTTLGEVTV